ncbi:MAG: hypothetical protein K6343_06350 [Caldisericaceae bacterium]
MKKTLFTIVILLVVFLLMFVVEEVDVSDKSLNTGVAGAKVNNFITDPYGKTVFLNFSFANLLSVERIGYKTTLVKLPFRLLFRKTDVQLEEGDAQYIKEQINSWLGSVIDYKYTFQNITKDKNYTFTQIIDGDNIYTKTLYTTNEKTTSLEIFVLNGKVYTKEDGGSLREITENKEDFLDSNLILIPLSDVIYDFFSEVNEKVIFESPQKIVFIGKNANLTMELLTDGQPEKFTLEVLMPVEETSILTVDLKNTSVSINEN